MAVPTSVEASTSWDDRQLGMTVCMRMCSLLWPMARSLVTYSDSRTTSTMLRIIRAYLGQDTRAMARTAFIMLLPMMEARAMASRMPGKDMTMSAKRMSTSSAALPKKPAAAP